MSRCFYFGVNCVLFYSLLGVPHSWGEEPYSPVEQFIVDKPTDLVAIVLVETIENCWAQIEGDMIPFIASKCTLVEQISGDKTWPKGASQTILQSDCSSMIQTALASPPLKGRKHFVWLSAIPPTEQMGTDADWIAHPQGFFLLRGGDGNEFIYWDQKRYRLADLRKALTSLSTLGLDMIDDPVKRMKVAEKQIDRGKISDVDSMIRGLVINVQDPEGQAKLSRKPVKSDAEEDLEFFQDGNDQPHYIWFQSLSLLRDLGKIDECRERVVQALIPFLSHKRPKIQFVSALALADLGDDHGKNILLKSMSEEPEVVSADADSAMTFYGRFQYDDSTVMASAYALGKLGDRQGLDNDNLDIQIITADGLIENGNYDVKEHLENILVNLNKEVDQLKDSGVVDRMRDPSDQKERYPIQWIKVHAMLARLGNDESLKILIQAWIQDMKTYPVNEELVPHCRIVEFDSFSKGWYTLGRAIRATSNDRESVLKRLKSLFESDPSWSSSPLVNLRSALGDNSVEVSNTVDEDSVSIQKRIEDGLKSDDQEKRAESLAAAGLHRLNEYFETVLMTALKGEGIERQASIYALGFYKQSIPEATMSQIIMSGSSSDRLLAFEVATRRYPDLYVDLGIQILRMLVADLTKAKKQEEDLFEFEMSLRFGIQSLSRVCRGGIPEPLIKALKDPDPAFRTVIVQALGMSGNPSAAPHLAALKDDPDSSVREAAIRAIQILGPE